MAWAHPGERACALIRDKELHGLALFDGCACGHFCIFDIDVGSCCHRTSREDVDGPAVTVDARSPDITPECLRMVGQEVARQLREAFGYEAVAIVVREDDGEWQECN